MNKVSTKLIILLILSALVPLILFGAVALWTARQTARQIVAEENLQVAKRAAHQIEQYVNNSTAILEALTQNLGKTDLLAWQKERMVRNYTLQFEQFQVIDLADRKGRLVATSRLHTALRDQSRGQAIQTALTGQVYQSQVFISENFVPSMIVAIPVQVLGEVQGVIVGELNLIEMWRLVDSIRIGQEGHAMVVSKEGLLIAHGLPTAKERVLRQERISHLPIVQAALKGSGEAIVYRDERGVEQIGVAASISSLGWGLVIEQPTREAYSAATRLTYQLAFLVGVFLILMILIGTLGGRRYVVAPVRELIRGIRTVGGGNLAKKVKILTQDEFRELGEAFNQMTDRLSAFEDEIRRNERAVMLGRIASGLVHDLKHPIKNLENNSLLLLRYFDDPKIRDIFRKVVEREFENLNRFLDDLLHLARPTAIQPVSLLLSRFVEEFLESFRAHPLCVVEGPDGKPIDPIKEGKVLISVQIDPPDLRVWADRFGLERVLKNLITNAIEALPQGGRITIAAHAVPSSESFGSVAEIAISDTGSGIPPDRLKNLFMDYATTKRKGIGLGLAICKKIMDEHKATMEVQSRSGRGTTFLLRFPGL